MIKNRLTRPWAGALFRARRVQCALLLMTALIGSAAVMTGCKGTARITGPGFEVEAEFVRNPGPDRGRPCGTMTYNGRTYDLYCDQNGRLIYAHDPVSDRWYRVTKQEEAGWLPSDYPVFEHDGVMYFLPPDPVEHVLELPSELTALEIAHSWGASLDAHGSVVGAARWIFDRSTQVLDVRLCLDWSVGAGIMDVFPLAVEMRVIADGTAGVTLFRVIGPRLQVNEYLTGMGLSIDTLEIDGFGPVSNDLIGSAGWIVTAPSFES